MSAAFRTYTGLVTLCGLNQDKVEALIRVIEGASLPDKQLLQEELNLLRSPILIHRGNC